jgi:hypothetical protein
LLFSLPKLIISKVYILINLPNIWMQISRLNVFPNKFFIGFLGNVSVQSYLNTTRIYVNPSIPVIDLFKQRYFYFVMFYIVFYNTSIETCFFYQSCNSWNCSMFSITYQWPLFCTISWGRFSLELSTNLHSKITSMQHRWYIYYLWCRWMFGRSPGLVVCNLWLWQKFNSSFWVRLLPSLWQTYFQIYSKVFVYVSFCWLIIIFFNFITLYKFHSLLSYIF